MTGYTIVTREPEWDDYARAEALALLADDDRRCNECGLPMTYELIDGGPKVTWPDGRAYQVKVLRCQGCGARDIVRRDYDRKHKAHEHVEGKASPGDGLRLSVEPSEE